MKATAQSSTGSQAVHADLAPGPTIPRALLAVAQTRNLISFLEWCDRRYGQSFRLPVGGGMTIFTDPDDVQAWLGKTDGRRFVRGRYFEALATIGGKGVVTVDGPEWSRRRKAMMPAFSSKALDELTPLARDALRRSMQELTNYARSGQEVDLSKHLHDLTMRLFLDTMLSSDMADQASEVISLMDAQSKWITGAVLTSWAPSWFPVPGRRQGRPATERLRQIINTVITERRANPVNRPDLLGRLLDVREEGTDELLSNDDLCNEMIHLLVGAYDTTALALEWSVALLATNPETMDTLRDEADAYDGDFATIDDLRNLPYAKAVFLEAQRIQGNPLVAFQASADTVIGGHLVPAGTEVAWSGYLMGLNPKVWDNPRRFEPRRFLGEGATQQHGYQHIPFGAGPHMCLGFRMAYLVGQFALTMLAQQFDIQLRPGHAIEHQPGPFFTVKGGVPVTLSLRKPHCAATSQGETQ